SYCLTTSRTSSMGFLDGVRRRRAARPGGADPSGGAYGKPRGPTTDARRRPTDAGQGVTAAADEGFPGLGRRASKGVEWPITPGTETPDETSRRRAFGWPVARPPTLSYHGSAHASHAESRPRASSRRPARRRRAGAGGDGRMRVRDPVSGRPGPDPAALGGDRD